MLIDGRVTQRLSATRFGDLRLLDVTDSTNRVVRDLAEAGAPEGVVVAADLQTAGRGRLDRTWHAQPGSSLLVSVLLRPSGLEPTRWHLLTAAAGLAAQGACEDEAGFRPSLKWPNDLLVDGRKLAGILAETASGAAVVGVGLNVHSAPPGAASADEAAGRRVPRGPLLASWLVRLDRLLGGGWDDLAALYASRCDTVGQEVSVDMGASGTLRGVAEGIDPGGRLLVRPRGGEDPVAVAVGDVTHLRPAAGR